MTSVHTLGTLAAERDNNFRLIRLVAACTVVISHGSTLTQGLPQAGTGAFAWLTEMGSGDLAVDVFFVTSGFLVCRSLLQRRDVVDYVLSRILRITPALSVSVLIAAFVLGPFVTTLPLGTYFSTRYLYSFVVIDALSISPFHQRFELPGVFADLPYPNVVNAPLWTLPWEIWMYIGLLLLFMVRLLDRAMPLILASLLAAYSAVALGWWQVPEILSIALRLGAFFFCGVVLATHGARLPLTWRWLLVATVAFAMVNWATQSSVLLPLWLAYSVIFIAYKPALVLKRQSQGPDFSYGIYIYAYMVQQTLVWWWGPHDPLVNGAAALLLTTPLAMASWYLIEEPMLMFKQRLRRKRHLSGSVEALG